MKHIILSAREIEGVTFDLMDLADYLNQLADPRDNRGKVYQLGSLLAMIVMARLSGEDKPKGIFEWLRLRKEVLVKQFGLKRQQTPCLMTIRTILGEVVPAEELEQMLQRYLLERYGGQTSELLCIDGKTMRGTIPKGHRQGVHLLSAYLAEEGIVLKQIAVGKKANEISASARLLEGLPVKNRVICADAMQTQRAFCRDVLNRGGDYLLWVKANQPTMQSDIEQFFKPARRSAGWHIPTLPYTSASASNKGHGRIEKRTITVMEDRQQFLDWPGVGQVFKLERWVLQASSGKETMEIVYGLTSCSPERADAEALLQWTRAYWGIENGLHYRRDVTLREDSVRTECDSLAQTIATLNNFIVGLAAKLGYHNLASARRYFDACISKQLFPLFTV